MANKTKQQRSVTTLILIVEKQATSIAELEAAGIKCATLSINQDKHIAELETALLRTNKRIEILIEYWVRTDDHISAGFWRETLSINQQALPVAAVTEDNDGR